MCARQPIEIRTNIDLHRLIQIQALFNFWVWVQHIFRMSEVFSAETIASLIMNQRYVHNFHFYYETLITSKNSIIRLQFKRKISNFPYFKTYFFRSFLTSSDICFAVMSELVKTGIKNMVLIDFRILLVK